MEKITIGRIIALALALRIGLAVSAFLITRDPGIYHAPDTASYLEAAGNLVASARFANSTGPEIVRTPGYPLLLIPGILLGHVEAATIVLQILLSVFTVFMVYRIGLILFKRDDVARLGAFFYAIEPLSNVYVARLLAETLFTALLVAGMYFVLRFYERRAVRQLIPAAVLLAAAVYVKPIAYFLPIVIALVLVIAAFSSTRRKARGFIAAGVFFVIAMSLVGLWQIRNSHQAGYSGFSAITDINLYFYQGAAVLAAKEGVPYYAVQGALGYQNPEGYLANHPEQREWSPAQRYRAMRRKAVNILLGNPVVYAEIHIKGMLRLLLDPGAMEYLKLFKLYPKTGGLLGKTVDRGLLGTIMFLLQEKPVIFWTNVFLALFVGMYYLLSCMALIFGKFRPRMPWVLLLVLGLYFIILSGGPNSLARFRHPIMPWIALLAGYGLALLLGRLGKSTSAHILVDKAK